MPTRFSALVLACSTALCLLPATPGWTQSDQEIGQMRLYVQQLEEQVRRLTGENEELRFRLNQLAAQSGAAPGAAPAGALIPPGAAAQPGLVTQAPLSPGVAQPGAPQDLATGSVAPDDPLVAPDGAGLDAPGQGGPIDLSTLAAGVTGVPGAAPDPALGTPPAASDPLSGNGQVAALPSAPQGQLSGSARDEYDAAYAYILTGDYDAAEKRFSSWLASFPSDPQAPDAQFWLGESLYQQGKAREAATTFLNLHKSAPQSSKAPDALMKLGMSLARLGEVKAACATLAEVGLRYPNASATVAARVNEESRRNKC